MLLMSALVRISETETELYRLERKLEQYKKENKLNFLGKVKYVLFGKSFKK